MSNLTDYIEQFVLDKLNEFNAGRNADKGVYYMLLPNEKTAYYTLWFYNPAAVYHPNVYFATLDVNAINSVEKAMKKLANSFIRLDIRLKLESISHNADDVISFGKYRGYHLCEVTSIDPKYVTWIANKYEPRTQGEKRFKELAATYSWIYQDLHTSRMHKVPVSRFVGTIDEKLNDLHLSVLRVKAEDNPYKTRTVGGIAHFYVDQKIVATDEAGNLFFFTLRASDRSLVSGQLSNADHAYQVGEKLLIRSAKVIKHYTSRNIRYTKLGYVKFK
ncbi:exodeoxyribonuclease X C-terminal domain-containing protein [Parabacteroides sp.]